MCVIVPIVYHRNPWGFISEECQPHPPARENEDESHACTYAAFERGVWKVGAGKQRS